MENSKFILKNPKPQPTKQLSDEAAKKIANVISIMLKDKKK